MLDTAANSIRYMATREIQIDEELCIFYGHKLWFEPSESALTMDRSKSTSEPENPVSDEWETLRQLSLLDTSEGNNPFLDGDPLGEIKDADLPVVRTSVVPDEEEDEDSFVSSL